MGEEWKNAILSDARINQGLSLSILYLQDIFDTYYDNKPDEISEEMHENVRLGYESAILDLLKINKGE